MDVNSKNQERLEQELKSAGNNFERERNNRTEHIKRAAEDTGAAGPAGRFSFCGSCSCAFMRSITRYGFTHSHFFRHRCRTAAGRSWNRY